MGVHRAGVRRCCSTSLPRTSVRHCSQAAQNAWRTAPQRGFPSSARTPGRSSPAKFSNGTWPTCAEQSTCSRAGRRASRSAPAEWPKVTRTRGTCSRRCFEPYARSSPRQRSVTTSADYSVPRSSHNFDYIQRELMLPFEERREDATWQEHDQHLVARGKLEPEDPARRYTEEPSPAGS